MDTPSALADLDDDAPLTRAEEWVYAAFCCLSTERQVGFGVGPIPDSKVVDYAVRSGLRGAMMEGVRDAVRTLDREYLRWIEKDRERRAAMNDQGIRERRG